MNGTLQEMRSHANPNIQIGDFVESCNLEKGLTSCECRRVQKISKTLADRLIVLSFQKKTYILNFCKGKDLLAFACNALENNSKSEALITLAGETNPIMSVVGLLFERVLDELEIAKPTKIEAQLVVAHYYARAIRNGSLTPYEGACEIWWKISNEIENPADILLSFVGAASEIEDLSERYKNDSYDPISNIEEHKKQIIEAAGKLLDINDPVKLLSVR